MLFRSADTVRVAASSAAASMPREAALNDPQVKDLLFDLEAGLGELLDLVIAAKKEIP